MWTNQIRRTITIIIYTVLFAETIDGFDALDDIRLHTATIAEELGFELSPVDLEYIEQQIGIFKNQHAELTVILKKHLSSWDKTYDLVKACLYTGQLELNACNSIETEETKKLVSKYIHLTQDLVGGQNPSLVHAILSTISEQPA